MVELNTPAETPTTRRLPSLTGLRALAAGLVYAVHAPYVIPVDSPVVPYTDRGAVGVSFFFILSGFILTWSHQQRRVSSGVFYRRRFARVYPTHVLTWAIAILLLLWEGHRTGVLPGLSALTLTQSWIPNDTYYYAADSVSWSLADEAFFYALFPLLFVILIRRGVRFRRCLGAAALVAIVLVAVFIADEPGSHGFWMDYILPLTRLGEFVIGIVAGLEVLDGWRSGVRYRAALAIALASLIAVMFLPAEWGLVAVTVVPFTLLIAAAAVADLDGTPTTFGKRTWIKLGEWSFAFYLIHTLVLNVTREVLPAHKSVPVMVLALTCTALISVALAAVVHEFYERPLERRIRGGARPTELAP